MFTLESALQEIYAFFLKILKTYYFTLIKCNVLIRVVKIKNSRVLLNPFIYFIISFFIFFSYLNSFSDEADSPIVAYGRIKYFFNNYDLIDKLLIISPLIISAEVLIRVFGRILIYNTDRRILFTKLFRYVLGTQLITVTIIIIFVQFIEFSLAILDEEGYYFKVFNFSIILAFIPVIFGLFFCYYLYKDKLYKGFFKKVFFYLIPFISFGMYFKLCVSIRSIYSYYNLRISTSKVHALSVDREEELILNLKNEDLLKLKSKKDSGISVYANLLIKNDAEKDIIVDSNHFVISVSCRCNSFFKEKHTDSTDFFLRGNMSYKSDKKIS